MLLNFFALHKMATIMNFIQITANNFNEIFACVSPSHLPLTVFFFFQISRLSITFPYPLTFLNFFLYQFSKTLKLLRLSSSFPIFPRFLPYNFLPSRFGFDLDSLSHCTSLSFIHFHFSFFVFFFLYLCIGYIYTYSRL